MAGFGVSGKKEPARMPALGFGGDKLCGREQSVPLDMPGRVWRRKSGVKPPQSKKQRDKPAAT